MMMIPIKYRMMVLGVLTTVSLNIILLNRLITWTDNYLASLCLSLLFSVAGGLWVAGVLVDNNVDKKEKKNQGCKNDIHK
jgi:hypothetical protein